MLSLDAVKAVDPEPLGQFSSGRIVFGFDSSVVVDESVPDVLGQRTPDRGFPDSHEADQHDRLRKSRRPAFHLADHPGQFSRDGIGILHPKHDSLVGPSVQPEHEHAFLAKQRPEVPIGAPPV